MYGQHSNSPTPPRLPGHELPQQLSSPGQDASRHQPQMDLVHVLFRLKQRKAAALKEASHGA